MSDAVLNRPSRSGDGHVADAADLLAHAAHVWLCGGRAMAMATVIETWGSAPVPVGGQMAIASAAEFEGSVSGGCIEGEVVMAACAVIESGAPVVREYGVTHETAWDAGLPCGGRIRIHIERLAGPADAAVLKRLAALKAARSPVVVATDLATGTRALLTDRATMPPAARAALDARTSRIEAAPAGEAFLHVRLPPTRLVVVGATHIAQSVSRLARRTGYEVVVLDPRTAFATADRFPDARLIREWPRDGLPTLGLDTGSAVLALAHVGHIDDEALMIALDSPAFYVGALGSTRNHARRVDRLLKAGLGARTIARIHAPIGLDIGALTAEEIALSILAEVVLESRGPKRGFKPA